MEWILTLTTAAALFGLFAVSETANRRAIHADSTRRCVHVLGAGTAALFPIYLQLRDVLVLAAVFTLFLTYTFVQGSLRSIHAVARPSIGAVLFPIGLGCAALAVWGHPGAFAFAALVLAVADPAAALVGSRVTSLGWRVTGGNKTLSGSLTIFIVSAVLAGIFGVASGKPSIVNLMVVAAILTMIEGSLGYGLDNLPLPLAAAILGRTLLGL